MSTAQGRSVGQWEM